MSDDAHERRLEELVRDERARRVFAEQELGKERERAAVWRRRAEERAEALERARSDSASWIGRWRRTKSKAASTAKPSSSSTESPSTTTPSPPETEPSISQPTLRVGEWGAPTWLDYAADTFSVADQPDALAWADLVVVGADGARPALSEWVTWEARPPLVLWEPGPDVLTEWDTHLTERDLVVGAEHGTAISIPPVPVAADPHPSPEEGWQEITGGSLSDAVARACRAPLVWGGAGGPPTEMEGLIAHGASDLRKQAIRARLVLRSRFGPGAALERIASAAGLDLPPWQPEVGLLVVTRRPERVPGVLERISRLRYPRVRVVVGLHGVGDGGEVEGIADRLGIAEKTEVLRLDGSSPLGRCLNQAAESVGSGILAKVDDDDLYGPWYLDEAVAQIEAGRADLVGKVSQYVHLVESDRLVLYQPGTEETEVGYVNGPTFVMPRATWENVRFPHRAARVDSTFVRGLKAVGGTIRATSRYEFVLGRYSSGHTWETSDDHFLARGEVVGAGGDLAEAWLDS